MIILTIIKVTVNAYSSIFGYTVVFKYIIILNLFPLTKYNRKFIYVSGATNNLDLNNLLGRYFPLFTDDETFRGEMAYQVHTSISATARS